MKIFFWCSLSMTEYLVKMVVLGNVTQNDTSFVDRGANLDNERFPTTRDFGSRYPKAECINKKDIC